MKKYMWIIPLAALVLAQIACGTSTNGTKVGEIATVANTAVVAATKEGTSPDATKAPAKKEATPTTAIKNSTYKIGDIIEIKDERIRVNGAEFKAGVLKINFTIENTGTKDILVSSILSFSAKDSQGAKLDQVLVGCGTSMDGSVLPGDKLKGDVCYKLAVPGTVKLYYTSTSNVFLSGAAVWVLDTSNLATVTEPTTGPKGITPDKIFKVGEVIELEGQKIVLNSVKIVGNVVKASFTIENTGTEDIIVSSLMLFSVQSPDGTKMKQNLTDCGTNLIDGGLFSGDKVKGDICWSTNGATDLKIYYNPTLLAGGDTVVWEVK